MSLLWIFLALSLTKYLPVGKSKWSPRETQTIAGSFKGQSSRKLKFKRPTMSLLKNGGRDILLVWAPWSLTLTEGLPGVQK